MCATHETLRTIDRELAVDSQVHAWTLGPCSYLENCISAKEPMKTLNRGLRQTESLAFPRIQWRQGWETGNVLEGLRVRVGKAHGGSWVEAGLFAAGLLRAFVALTRTTTGRTVLDCVPITCAAMERDVSKCGVPAHTAATMECAATTFPPL